jgi:hypothetical protein
MAFFGCHYSEVMGHFADFIRCDGAVIARLNARIARLAGTSKQKIMRIL